MLSILSQDRMKLIPYEGLYIRPCSVARINEDELTTMYAIYGITKSEAVELGVYEKEKTAKAILWTVTHILDKNNNIKNQEGREKQEYQAVYEMPAERWY